MFGIRRALRNAKCKEHDNCCHNVANRIHGIRDQGKRVPNDAADELDNTQQQIHRKAKNRCSGDFLIEF